MTLPIESDSRAVTSLIANAFKDECAPWPAQAEELENNIFDFISKHGLISILYYQQSKTGCCKDWPCSLLAKIQAKAKLAGIIDKLREEELIKVLEEMEIAGIHPILLKGSPLSYTCYPELGLRPRCDTDILIARIDMEPVAELMKQRDYQPLYEGSTEFISSQVTFLKQDDLKIAHAYDVHWQISNKRRVFSAALNYDYLVKNALAIPELGVNAKTLNTVDALLLACYHRAGHFSHMGERLIWLYDIHLLMEKLTEQEAEKFYQKAKILEIIAICSDAIFTAQSWFGTIVAESFSLQLMSLNKQESSTAYLKKGRLEGIKTQSIIQFGELSSGRERFIFLFQKVFPPVNYMIWRYQISSRFQLPFYYGYRVIYGIYIFLGWRK